MTLQHHSTTIINPTFADLDLSKRELLYLLGGEKNMLNACPSAIEWIQSLPDDVLGEWIWDNLPQVDWYCWILSEIWDVEHEFLAAADPDWFDLAADTLQAFVENAYQEEREAEDSRFLYRCRKANEARRKRLVDPHYRKFQDRTIGKGLGAAVWSEIRNEYLEQVKGYDTLYERVKVKLEQRINSSSEIKAIRRNHAKHIRESGLLPDWAQVCKVLRHFYDRESIHSTEFWEEYNNG